MTQKGRKDDQGKSRVDLIPPESLIELGFVLSFGGKRYGENNWQEVDNFEKRYIAAALRHIYAHQSGELYDNGPEGSGRFHLSHALACIAFLVYKLVKDELRRKIPTNSCSHFTKRPIKKNKK